MDTKTIYLLVGIPTFFLLLHLAVIPILRKIAIAVQGEPFTYRLQTWMDSKATGRVSKWDILWSALAVMLVMTLSGLALVLLGHLGVVPKMDSPGIQSGPDG